jgi:hypothetical protein
MYFLIPTADCGDGETN